MLKLGLCVACLLLVVPACTIVTEGDGSGGSSGSNPVVSSGGSPGATPTVVASSGGAPAATGGTPAATGGTPAATGGTPAGTGGTPAATGGTPAAGGSAATRIYTGYSLADAPASVTFMDVCASGVGSPVTGGSVNLSDKIPLPFGVHFYAETYDSLRISQNGWISFSQYVTDSAPRNNAEPEVLPIFGSPNAAVYALWGSLGQKGDKDICYGTQGTAPNRTFIVEWNNSYFTVAGTPDSSLVFQIHLNEADDSIDVVYKTLTEGTTASGRLAGVTVGVENESTSPTEAGHGGTLATEAKSPPSAGKAIRFTPTR